MNIQYHVSLFMLKSITTINKTWFIFWKIFKDVPNLFCTDRAPWHHLYIEHVCRSCKMHIVCIFLKTKAVCVVITNTGEREKREIVSLYYILDILRIKRAGLSVLQYFDLVSPLPPLPPTKSWKNSPYKTTLL